MAIQNFVAGGFYGKLGAMVGQRWKNKRTLRVWVKGSNPRTPAQQANRGIFGEAVHASQLGNALNWKAPAFSSASNSDWGLRMSKARDLQKAGKEGLDLIPLYPLGYTPAFPISDASLIDDSAPANGTFYIACEQFEGERSVSVVMRRPATADADAELYQFRGRAYWQNGGWIEVENLKAANPAEGCAFLFVSNDDSKFDDKMLVSPSLPYKLAERETREFDFSSCNVWTVENEIFVQTSEPWQGVEGVATIDGGQFIRAGAYVAPPLGDVALINLDGFYGFRVLLADQGAVAYPAFPAGSSISLSRASVLLPLLEISAQNKTLALSNNDLTRHATLSDFLLDLSNEAPVVGARYDFDWIAPRPLAPFGGFDYGPMTYSWYAQYPDFDLTLHVAGQTGNTWHCYVEDPRLAQTFTDDEGTWRAYPEIIFYSAENSIILGGVTYEFTDNSSESAYWDEPQ